MALRRSAERFQFICPAAWGDQFPAPVAALSDGTLLVGAKSGLMLLRADGTLQPHPDPAALGHSSDVVRVAQDVFVLRSTTEGSELLGVDASEVRVLWKDSKAWYSLAPLDDKLVLARGDGHVLEQVLLTTSSGSEVERQAAVLDQPLDYVFARAAGGAPYALVVLRSTSVLGTLHMNTFQQLASGLVSIAGPLRVLEETLLALDGALAQLVDAAAKPLPDVRDIHCLDQQAELSYACNPDGIARLAGHQLGEPLFSMSWLSAPNLEQVPAGEARSQCSAQWQDLRADLALVGTTLLEELPQDAGVVDAATADGLPEAAISSPDAQSGVNDEAMHARAGSACSVSVGQSTSHTGFLHVCCLTVLIVAVRRRFVITSRCVR